MTPGAIERAVDHRDWKSRPRAARLICCRGVIPSWLFYYARDGFLIAAAHTGLEGIRDTLSRDLGMNLSSADFCGSGELLFLAAEEVKVGGYFFFSRVCVCIYIRLVRGIIDCHVSWDVYIVNCRARESGLVFAATRLSRREENDSLFGIESLSCFVIKSLRYNTGDD